VSTLGGNVVIRNGNEFDFCWREAVQSLLPVCDTVTICDGESSDGTQQQVREWASREPKIKLCVYPWPHPKGDPDFFVKWINYAREHVKADFQFQLDADEVLYEKSYDAVRRFVQKGGRRSAIVTRWNFWRDHRHTIPEGVCLGKHVIRIAPQNVWLASDGSHPMGAEAVAMAVKTSIEIFHYGFLRKREEFFKKERLLHGMFFNSYDPRLEKAEKETGNWMAMPGLCGWENNLSDYGGEHPEVAKAWLNERGYPC
jgi:glycosyltransferase involved in cell wall biosynthesis